MKYYADTSFILSIYIQQDSSKAATGFLQHHKISLLFTSLNRHEFRNAVRLCVFRRQITGKEAVSVLNLLEEDLKTGVFLSANVPWSLAFNIAEELSEKHTESMGIRGMDILHVAVARSLDVSEFLTFDIRQKALAEKAGMKVRPVAKIVPYEQKNTGFFGMLHGSVNIKGDIVKSAGEKWEADED